MTSKSIDLKGKKILVTGGAGFIMTNFIRRLDQSNYITIFDNLSRNSLKGTDILRQPNIKLIQGDICVQKDLGLLEKHEIVVHAAAIAGIHTIRKSPVETMRVNFQGTANLLEVVSKWNNLERFINFSTSEIFGQFAFRARETDFSSAGDSSEARWTYAVSKLASEHLAFSYYREKGVPIVNLRPFNVYGPGQTGEGALGNFIKQALVNDNLIIDGDGSQIRAWCYIDDFIDALYSSLVTRAIEGHSFNIGNPRGTITILGLANLVCRVLGSSSKIVFGDKLAEDVEIRVPDGTKAFAMLKFSPKIDLEYGIKLTADWMKENVKCK